MKSRGKAFGSAVVLGAALALLITVATRIVGPIFHGQTVPDPENSEEFAAATLEGTTTVGAKVEYDRSSLQKCDRLGEPRFGKSRDANIERQVDVARQLALTVDDADLLLAGAILTAGVDTESEALAIRRALEIFPGYRAAAWYQLLRCAAISCDREHAEAAALAVDADNGQVWLEIAGERIRTGRWAEARKALRQAANSTRFETYWVNHVTAIERALASSTDFSYRERMIHAMGYAAAIPVPSFADLGNVCRAESGAPGSWVDICANVGEQLRQSGNDLLTLGVGYKLASIVAERRGDANAVERYRAQSRALWNRTMTRQQEAHADALLANDPAVMQRYVENYRVYGEIRAMELLAEEAIRLSADETYDQCNFVRRPYDPS